MYSIPHVYVSYSMVAQLLIGFPLVVGLWGASLFKPGNTGAGFAASTQKQQAKK